jgi:hypothetical protein
MEARDPEQQATMEMTTNAQRVGSVLISESNFIAKAMPETLNQSRGCRRDGGVVQGAW